MSIDEEVAKQAVRQVVDTYEEDKESRTGWEEQLAKHKKLYFQIEEPVNQPWNGSSTESLPLLAEACNQFHSRAVKTLLPPQKKLFAVMPSGKVDPASIERAERVQVHLNHQILTQNKNYREDKDALILYTAMHGTCFTKVFPREGRYAPIIRNVRAEDLIMPYGIGPRSIEEIDRKTQQIYMSLQRAKMLAASGYFMAEPAAWDEEEQSATDEAMGFEMGWRSGDCKLLEQHTYFEVNGEIHPMILTVDAKSKKLLRIRDRRDPATGDPMEYFTQYNFLPNPDGTLGLGMGHLIGRINTACNKILRQTIDAAELANAGNMSGFIDDAVGLEGEETEMVLGKFAKVRASGDLSRSFFQFKFPGPQPVMGEILQLLTGRSDRLATVTDALTGHSEKVMQPTAILALIDQGLQVFSTIMGRMIAAQTREIEKVYALNSLYLEDDEYFAVLDETGAPQGQNVARTDYDRDQQIIALADPLSVSEQQKLTRAQAELEFVMTNPLTQQNPQAIYAAGRRYLDAIGAQNIGEIFPEPQQQAPVRVDDPKQENVGALMATPNIPPVHIDQNHLAHIRAHDELLNDAEYGEAMTKEGREALEAHRQEHIAYLYAATETNLLEDIEGGA